MIVNDFFKELSVFPLDGLQLYDIKVQATQSKLPQLMTLLNSVQLYGRYKQIFKQDYSMITLTHTAPLLHQTYTNGMIYRNPTWIYGKGQLDSGKLMPESVFKGAGGSAIYKITIPKVFAKSIVDFRGTSDNNEDGNLMALPPWQVLEFLGDYTYEWGAAAQPAEGEVSHPLRVFKVFQF